jgi:hypothetical protein
MREMSFSVTAFIDGSRPHRGRQDVSIFRSGRRRDCPRRHGPCARYPALADAPPGRAADRIAGSPAGAVAAASSFATTYAPGYAASRHDAGGRALSAQRLARACAALREQAASLQQRYRAQIARRAQAIDIARIALPARSRQARSGSARGFLTTAVRRAPFLTPPSRRR